MCFLHSGVQFFDIGTSKSVRHRQFFSIFTWKCAARHSGVQFFDIGISKSAPTLTCFVHFHFKMCFFAAAACDFWFLLWPPDSAPAALTSQHFATSLTFGAGESSFFWLSRYCIFFLLTWLFFSSAFQLSILSEVRLLNFLRLFKLPSMNNYVYRYIFIFVGLFAFQKFVPSFCNCLYPL